MSSEKIVPPAAGILVCQGEDSRHVVHRHRLNRKVTKALYRPWFGAIGGFDDQGTKASGWFDDRFEERGA